MAISITKYIGNMFENKINKWSLSIFQKSWIYGKTGWNGPMGWNGYFKIFNRKKKHLIGLMFIKFDCWYII